MKPALAHLTGIRSGTRDMTGSRIRDNDAVPDVTTDPIWQSYERAADAHRRAMRVRLELSDELTRRFAEDRLAAWDDAHREEERCFEVLTSTARAVRAKYGNL